MMTNVFQLPIALAFENKVTDREQRLIANFVQLALTQAFRDVSRLPAPVRNVMTRKEFFAVLSMG